MEIELWKDIPDYEGIYEASTHGRIRSKQGKVTKNSRYDVRVWESRIMKPKGQTYKTGYRVSLWKDGIMRDWLVARLIALTFIGKSEVTKTVNHIDNNRFNNHIENLEWLTLKENIQAGFETGAYPQNKTILTEEDGTMHIFKSQSKASEFVERQGNYIGCAYEHGRKAKSKNGIYYDIIIEKHK